MMGCPARGPIGKLGRGSCGDVQCVSPIRAPMTTRSKATRWVAWRPIA